jgi:AraC-like DNA-binding protein
MSESATGAVPAAHRPQGAAMGPPPLLFSARPGLEGFETWREAFALKVARLDVTVHDRSRFSADIRIRPLPGVTLAHNRVDACSLIRTPELLRDDDDAVTLLMCHAGGGNIRTGDDTAAMLPGRAILMPIHRPSDSMWQSASESYTLRMERDAARRVFPSIEAALMRPTAPGDPALALLNAYCVQLMALPGPLPAATASLAGAQIQELIAHLAGNRDAIDIAEGSGLSAARLCAIKDDIARNLDRRDLSAATLAARHRMTPRHLQRLFDGEGTTFTEYLLAQRLARVHRSLQDPRRARDKISTLVFEAGFHDLSHFARAFRRHFGMAPSDLRARRDAPN